MHLTDVDFLGMALQQKRDSTHFKRLLNLTPEFQIVVSESDVRSVAESCIQSRFHAAYGAEINEFHVANVQDLSPELYFLVARDSIRLSAPTGSADYGWF